MSKRYLALIGIITILSNNCQNKVSTSNSSSQSIKDYQDSLRYVIFDKISGNYQGTFASKEITGIARVRITNLGNIVLDYSYQNPVNLSPESLTEYGYLILDSSKTTSSIYAFKYEAQTTKEMRYTVTINNNTIQLSGSNWNVVANKTTMENYDNSVNQNSNKIIDTITLKEATTEDNESISENDNKEIQSTQTDINSDSSLIIGLVAYYPFNGNTKDYSNSNYKGESFGVSLTPDRLNRNQSAFYFSGQQSFIDCGLSNNLKIYDEITMGGWFLVNSDCSSGRMISCECPEGNYRITVSEVNDNEKSINCSFGNVTLSTRVNVDTWYHIIFTYKNGTEMLYLNGKRVNEGSEKETEKLSYNCSVTIGRKASPNYDNWKGKLDDIVIYKRAINDNEVLKLYQSN